MTNAGGGCAQGKRSSHGQGKLNRFNITSRMAAIVTPCGRERMGFTPPYLLLEERLSLSSHDATRRRALHRTKVYSPIYQPRCQGGLSGKIWIHTPAYLYGSGAYRSLSPSITRIGSVAL